MMTIEAIREAIKALQQQRKAPQSSRLNVAETKAAIEAFVAGQAERYAQRLNREAMSVASRGTAATYAYEPFNPLLRDVSDVLPLLAAVLGPKALTKALTANMSGIEDGPSAEQRAAALADLDAQLFALGCAEERLIREAEALGESIPRRADADPKVVMLEVLP